MNLEGRNYPRQRMRVADGDNLEDDGIERSWSSTLQACMMGLFVERSLVQLKEQVVLILHESKFASNF
jgi:hypothetical protein